MRIFRQVLTLLLVLSLAATPALARSVIAVEPAPITKTQAKVAMPDCHGMSIEHEQERPGDHKSCPDCDKRAACAHDACQLKCFKVFADLPNRDRDPVFDFGRLAPAGKALAVPMDWEPRTPPPRS